MDCLAEGNPIKGFPYGFALQTHKRNAVRIVFHEYSMSAVALRIKKGGAAALQETHATGFPAIKQSTGLFNLPS